MAHRRSIERSEFTQIEYYCRNKSQGWDPKNLEKRWIIKNSMKWLINLDNKIGSSLSSVYNDSTFILFILSSSFCHHSDNFFISYYSPLYLNDTLLFTDCISYRQLADRSFENIPFIDSLNGCQILPSISNYSFVG